MRHGFESGVCAAWTGVKGTNPALKKPSNIPEIYAKMSNSQYSKFLRNVEDIDV